MNSIIIIIVIIAIVAAYLKSPAVKGKRSEQAVARKLKAGGFWGHDGKTLTNLYVPKASGGTSEIDVLYITQKGIFVLENKNYAGYIFGNEENKSWTVTLYAGKSKFGRKRVEKHQFYNPVMQNRTHIKSLKSYLNTNIRMFSIITFSNRGDLKDITIYSPEVYVCRHSEISRVIRQIWNESPDILSSSQIDTIYNSLLPLTDVSYAEKQRHVSEIQTRNTNRNLRVIENDRNTGTCPLCGGNLVIRTARKGENTGNKFIGCSNYPRCKYTKNI